MPFFRLQLARTRYASVVVDAAGLDDAKQKAAVLLDENAGDVDGLPWQGPTDDAVLGVMETEAPAAAEPAEAPPCPRMAESPMMADFRFVNRPDDGTCWFCGSLLGDAFMARLEAGDVQLGATDKNYKVYVHNAGGEPFRQSYRTDGGRTADQRLWTWTTREVEQTKFYFQHLSEEQRRRFVELLNTGKVRMYGGYGFRPLPFFVSSSPAKPEGGR